MRIVFMGTPGFAVPALSMLIREGCEVGFAVTQPDRQKNRGKKLTPTPVKERALELSIPVLQPERLRGNAEFFAELRNFQPHLIVVAAYGKILPKEILELPPLGCVNLHASLLPRYRGAAPIERAILAGEAETGITLMQMAEGLDTGDMLAVSKTAVGEKNAVALTEELAELGAALLRDNLRAIENGAIDRQKQDDSRATYAEMIQKSEGLIDFRRTPEEICRQVRGFYGKTGAYTGLDGEMFKIWQAQALETGAADGAALPGTVFAAGRDGIAIACGRGALLATVIQAPGKKRMPAGEFLKGAALKIGTLLKNPEE